MSLQEEHDHWSQKFERDVLAALQEQVIAQTAADTAVGHGNFIGAAVASFDQARHSLSVDNDQMTTTAQLVAGLAFLQTGLALQKESMEERTLFDIPECITDVDHSSSDDERIAYERGDKQYTEYAAKTEVLRTVAGVEAVLMQEIDVDSDEKNAAIQDALIAACDLYFSGYMREEVEYAVFGKVSTKHIDTSQKLVPLIQDLVSHLDLNISESSTHTAFSALQLAAAVACHDVYSGPFQDALLYDFKDILSGPCAEDIGIKPLKHEILYIEQAADARNAVFIRALAGGWTSRQEVQKTITPILHAATMDYTYRRDELNLQDPSRSWKLPALLDSKNNLNQPDPITFEVPECVGYEPQKDYIEGQWVRGRKYYTERATKEKVTQTVADVEALLNQDFEAASLIKNRAIKDALVATCDLYFSNYVRRRSDKRTLLPLIKELADHLDVNVDQTSTYAAFEALQFVAAAAIYGEGKTMPLLNVAQKGFEDMQHGPLAVHVEIALSQNIAEIKKARRSKLAYSSVAPLINFSRANSINSAKRNTATMEASRANKDLQDAAKQKYQDLRMADEFDLVAWLEERGLELETAESNSSQELPR